MTALTLRTTKNAALTWGELDDNFKNLNTEIARVDAKVVSVKDYGAVGDGVTDDTAAIQAALDSGAKSVYLQSGTYKITSLLMPNLAFFVLFGDGPSSILKLSGASGAGIRWPASSNVYNEQTVRNVAFDGSGGNQHCMDTTGAGGITIDGVYITDVPTGKSGIYVNGASAYVHDARLSNIQIYSNTEGHSGIRFGPYCSDALVNNFIMNGNVKVDYCLYYDAGAATVRVANSHPYNAETSIAYLAGNDNCIFSNCQLDWASSGDTVRAINSSHLSFTECHFQAIKSGFSGANITGTCADASFINCRWDGASGALSAVVSDASTSGVQIFGGSIYPVGNFTTPYDLGGTSSYAKGVAGWNPLGLDFNLSGVGAAAQSQSTTLYYGANGSNASEDLVEYVVPQDSSLRTLYVATNATPAAGQTFTFRARKNGSNIGSDLVISNGSYGGSVSVNTSFSQYDRLTISSVFSATSGSATVRFTANFQA